MAAIEERVDEQMRSFLSLTEAKYVSTPASPRPMDFNHKSSYLTVDVATCVTFGEPFGFLKRDGDIGGYFEMQDAALPMYGVLGTLPWLVHVIHTWPFTRILPGEGDSFGFGCLMK